MNLSNDELRQKIFDELQHLGFSFNKDGELTPPSSKEAIRELHRPSREIELRKSQKWIEKKYPKYEHFFAHGTEIVPNQIKPKLVQVTERWQRDLFRLARYYWSIPYSFGFGRRLRYLILDNSNQKLIGIFGLQSPPIGFPARDRLFSFPKEKKTELINQTMDIFTLGAIPPYSKLLAGKLIALSTVSNEVRQDYRSKYSDKKTEMEQRILPSHLVALTTTSAFGRSSIYNRLKFNKFSIAESIGYTKGYGNFHLQRLYPILKSYLELQDINTNGGYGTGPKRTWQLMRRALDKLEISTDLLKHGVKREAYLFRLIDNLEEYMEGKTTSPKYRDFPFDDLAAYWNKRWLKKRIERIDGWHTWDNRELLKSLTIGENNDV